MSDVLQRMSDFDLTPAQREVRRSVRAFAERELLPHVERFERAGQYPSELHQKLIAEYALGLRQV
ncbi:MAG TPA: acyl-CoA dehydrogenase family protein [Polyangiales bacterium]